MRIVLASGSPRRRELLASLGIRPDVEVPDVDESRHADEPPTEYVARLALAKAAAVADRRDLADAFVLAADTTVELDGEVLGKPTDPADARAALARLSGRRHLVHTGVAARRGARREHVVVTTVVTFRELTDGDLDRYVATGEPMDKAGSYAIQGAGGALVRRIDGSISNVVGLPLAEVVDLGRRLGVDLTDGRVTGSPGSRIIGA